jgi:signal transduction histidine kinase
LPNISRVSSSAVRLAAFFTVLFLALTGALILTVMWIVEGSQRGALQAANDADIAMIANGYRDEGVSEAIEVVRQRLTAPPASGVRPGRSYLLVQNGSGERLAGNMAPIVPRVGVFDLKVVPASTGLVGPSSVDNEASFDLRGRGALLGADLYVFAGRDWRIVSATRERILDAFVWVAAGAAIIASIAGWLLGSRFMQRVDDIARTCESIMGGQLSERIAVRGRGDEWDRLAGAINDMLNRIALLMENLQQVSSDVAHDLRSPLARLRNRLEAAHGGSTTVDEYAAAVARALEDTDQLLSMFTALLRISQVEAGTRAAAFGEVSLSDVAQRLFEMYRPVAEDYRHELECDIRPGVQVWGDAELLFQMFSNLIENAIRHTPTRSSIRITVGRIGDQPAASVRDNGEGIPPEEYAKVIRRFYRVSSSRSTAGHGLGLALVAAIAELHHASLLFGDAAPGLAVSVKFPPVRSPTAGDQRLPPGALGAPVSDGCSTSSLREPERIP